VVVVFLAQALLLSQLGTILGDSKVYGGRNDPRFEGLVLENKGKVVSPNGGQNRPEQKKKRNFVAGHDVVWTREEEAAGVLRRPDSLLYISR
jgi:hypothetical protein